MLVTGCPETKEDWIQLRWEANYYKAAHRRSIAREQVLKAKVAVVLKTCPVCGLGFQQLPMTSDSDAIHLALSCIETAGEHPQVLQKS